MPQIPSMADLIKNLLTEAPIFLEDLTELFKNGKYEAVLNDSLYVLLDYEI